MGLLLLLFLLQVYIIGLLRERRLQNVVDVVGVQTPS